MIYLVRHGAAIPRKTWEGPDSERPLTAPGESQAKEIAVALAGKDIDRVISSPAARCVATVQPLADSESLAVVTDDRLLEDGALEELHRFLIDAPAGTVICSHGDMIGGVITRLGEQGVKLHEEPRWEKGSIWALDEEEGYITAARYIVPQQ